MKKVSNPNVFVPESGCSNDKNGVYCESCATENIISAVCHPRSGIESNMNTLRGRLFTLIESMGFEQKREEAIKTQIREITASNWDNMIEYCFNAESLAVTMLQQLGHIVPEDEDIQEVDEAIVAELVAEQSKSKHT